MTERQRETERGRQTRHRQSGKPETGRDKTQRLKDRVHCDCYVTQRLRENAGPRNTQIVHTRVCVCVYVTSARARACVCVCACLLACLLQLQGKHCQQANFEPVSLVQWDLFPLIIFGIYAQTTRVWKCRKLKWYGLVTRSSGLAKTYLQGTVQGGKRRDRQRKRWEDNIKKKMDWP